jgi:hypothetical protein
MAQKIVGHPIHWGALNAGSNDENVVLCKYEKHPYKSFINKETINKQQILLTKQKEIFNFWFLNHYVLCDMKYNNCT